jgi:midasin
MQVWVSDIDDCEDILKLVSVHLPATPGVEEIAHRIVKFWDWYRRLDIMGKAKLSNRDLLAWCQFICEMHARLGLLQAYLHGIFLVLIDGSGLGTSGDAHSLKSACVQYLHGSIPDNHLNDLAVAACYEDCALAISGHHEQQEDAAMHGTEMPHRVSHWGIKPFVVPIGHLYDPQLSAGYSFDCPTTARNCFRLLRAMQVPQPILLEGSPGVGKTSLVTAVAAATGHELIRVNLSEQTEMVDLLGADLPASDGTSGSFEWAPGPLLRAVRSGAWVILDELNLASQAVLEGLNSLLDHRREIFIPELDETVRCAASFRVFAAQNPVQEGGGRKGLPRSFLNRFSRISLELLRSEDLLVILQQLYPQLPASCLQCMVKTVERLHESVNLKHTFGRMGGPWEFNLRDISRWCELIAASGVCKEAQSVALAGHYAAMLFSHKMQTKADKQQTEALIEQCWKSHPLQEAFCSHLKCPQKVSVCLNDENVRLGWCELSRKEQSGTTPPDASSQLSRGTASSGLELAAASVPALEWIATACKMAWMAVVTSPDVRRATQIVRTLASVCSQPLVEIPMSSTSDVSDLLGGFEQVDFNRTLLSAASRVKHVATVMLKDMLSSADSSTDTQSHTLDLLHRIHCFHFDQDESTAMQHAPAVIERLQQALTDLQAVNVQVAWSASVTETLGAVLATAEAAVAEAAAILREGKVMSTGGRFVWVDGLLLSAIENGMWALMLHANTCSAAVLDRLNSLLEPAGSLYINECGSCAGGPRIVRPHPNFRLLIVMDPSDGGLSRAMRNRGVEVFLDAHKFDEQPSRELALVCRANDLNLAFDAVVICMHGPKQWMMRTHIKSDSF